MRDQIHVGTVRSFNATTREATLVIPALYGNRPVVAQPLVISGTEISFATFLKPGDSVAVFFDGGQERTKPYWFTSAVSEDTIAAIRWNTALGVVIQGSTTNNILVINGSPGSDVTMPISFTPRVGRRYVVKYQTRAITGSPNPSTGWVSLWIDGAGVGLSDSWFDSSGAHAGRMFEWEIPSDGLPHTYNLRAVTSVGGITFHNQMGAGNCFFRIEDIGPQTPFVPGIPKASVSEAYGRIDGVVVNASVVGSDRQISWTASALSGRNMAGGTHGLTALVAGRYRAGTDITLANCAGGAYAVIEIRQYRNNVEVRRGFKVHGVTGYWNGLSLSDQFDLAVGDQLRVYVSSDFTTAITDSRCHLDANLIGQSV